PGREPRAVPVGRAPAPGAAGEADHRLLHAEAAGGRQRTGRSLVGVSFPERRLRRLRRTPALRRLVAETRLSVDDLVAPLFVREGIEQPQPIGSLPGVVQHTRQSLVEEVKELA